MKWLRTDCSFFCLLVFFPLVAGPPLRAQTASSPNYSMDYTSLTSGGNVASSSNYSMVSLVITEGASAGKSSSSHYGLETVAGAAESSTTAVALTEWNLF